MKITTFNPMILSKDAENTIKLFEELGFEKRHAPTVDTGKTMVTSTRMTDANGFHIDIADVKSVPQDMTIIRMNVDNFDEAFEMLTAKGFKHKRRRADCRDGNKQVRNDGLAFGLCIRPLPAYQGMRKREKQDEDNDFQSADHNQ